ncbi:MAG: exo-beta-N-acetylmuramidase NamZ domain-containing protein, partial [Pyrinomonadaceae bacterium]
MRHGMTVGELALMFNQEFNINCSLQVLEMQGWKRNYFYDETDAPWVMPSPNMPTVDTAVVFPGTVFFEGTQVSEGRGTTRPFEMIGAPYIDARKLAEEMNTLQLPGVIFRPVNFIPTFQKHSGKSCGGVFLHVTNRREFKPVLTGIALLKTIHDLYPLDFRWKEPPYEYVFDKNPFDVIAGTNKLRVQIESGCSLQEIVQSWKEDEETFAKKRQRYLLYD